MEINGKVEFIDIGPGCWGITDDKGNNWRVINMPSSMKVPGTVVSVTAKKVKEDVSLFMWGVPVKLV
jgi:hypothetical protein